MLDSIRGKLYRIIALKALYKTIILWGETDLK